MRICHVTPHLPPDQSANALLPYHLGCWAVAEGDQVSYIAHPPRQGRPDLRAPDLPGAVTWVPVPPPPHPLMKRLKVHSYLAAREIRRIAEQQLRGADIVHVHGNGLLAEYCAKLAADLGLSLVLTLYGTEIWHYRPKKGVDLFTRAYERATSVTFYSRGLLDFAVSQGLYRPRLRVVYPPIADEFQPADPQARLEARQSLGINTKNLLLNVKRLHPLAGQEFLVQAMPAILQAQPDTELVICGTGSLEQDLRAQAIALGVESRVRLAGLVDNATVAVFNRAADLFVLPSRLEACPTVALEALASGTPVVSSDNPGGVELHDLFGDDVAVVPREDPDALAAAVIAALSAGRRTSPSTSEALERSFRPSAVSRHFYEVYQEARRCR